MTKKELTDNLTFLSALGLLERLAGQGLLTPEETEKVKRELDRRIRPTLLTA